jgi:hypothetical protein
MPGGFSERENKWGSMRVWEYGSLEVLCQRAKKGRGRFMQLRVHDEKIKKKPVGV